MVKFRRTVGTRYSADVAKDRRTWSDSSRTSSTPRATFGPAYPPRSRIGASVMMITDGVAVRDLGG